MLHTAELLARKQLPAVLKSLVQLQFPLGQKELGPGGTGMELGSSMQLGPFALHELLLHELLRAGTTLEGHLPRVGCQVYWQLHPPAEGLQALPAREDLLGLVQTTLGFMLQDILLWKIWGARKFSKFGALESFLPSVFPVVHFLIFAEELFGRKKRVRVFLSPAV